MDVLLLSRLQFAATTFFHFLFVPLTLGLSILVAIMESRYARSGDETYLRMTRFWGKLFLINFAIGIVTGITLEFQFGTNWANYSRFVGDIFGSLLAIEATAAFFLESTLIGVWVFGWKRLSRKAHATVMWFVAGASNLSALWILTANAWMQHPVGYTLRNGRAELTNFAAVVFQSFSILEILHTLSAAYILAAFFVMGISAYHLLRKQHVEIFTKSFRLALAFGLIFSLFEVIEGHMHGTELQNSQPTKLAAMESHWETATNAPKYLFALPDEANERNALQIIPIPGMLSLLATHTSSGEVKGLKDFPREDRPPVLASYVSFQLMVALAFFFVLVTVVAWFRRNKLTQSPFLLKVMLFSIPLPYIANMLGWTLAEVGRQPWIVYGVMRTSDGISRLAPGQVLTSLIAFVLVYGLLGILGFYLLATHARKGPDPA
jgi:cytochrome d ubiquinol oxidase subunit I